MAERARTNTGATSVASATQALAEVLDVVEPRPLHAYLAKSNVASIRVLEKCGFTAVATNDEEHAGEVLLRLG